MKVAGYNLRTACSESNSYNLNDIDDVCHTLGRLLMSIIKNEAVSSQKRQSVLYAALDCMSCFRSFKWEMFREV